MTKKSQPILERAAKPLPPEKLRNRLDPATLPYEDSRKVPKKNGQGVFQPRAMQALRMALMIPGLEYNVFVAGEPGQGRTHFVRQFLLPEAAKRPTPCDWIYLHNFEDEDRPFAISLTAGQGRAYKTGLAKALTDVRQTISASFDQDAYRRKHETLFKRFSAKRDSIYNKMEIMAREKGFALDMDDTGGLTIMPLVGGKVMADEEYGRLAPARRKMLKTKGERLLSEISGFLRKLSLSEQGFRQGEVKLHREIAKEALTLRLKPLRKEFAGVQRLVDHMAAVEKDILDNVEAYLPRDAADKAGGGAGLAAQGHAHADGHGLAPAPDDANYRHEVNLFVDNSKTAREHGGAPVIVEDHPTAFNLLGSIERESELGAFYTDFTLVRAGSAHRANGGFLIVNIEDLMGNQGSWEGLLRGLRLGKLRMEDPGDAEQARTRTIEPEPIPLNLKIILVGTDEAYEALLTNDDRFRKHFKLKAHLQGTVARNAASVRHYLSALVGIIDQAGLPPFSRDALAGLVDHASRLAEDQKLLTLSFTQVRGRMIEAAALARMDSRDLVELRDLNRAVADHDFRANLFEEEFMTDYDREIIKVATGGSAVGRANGLSVTLFGDYEFGLPHQISCTVGVGHGGILDLEREAQLGGPIHTKGMMIIKSYLVRLFAQDKPLVLTGSLCFEQNYAGVEGDSASGAELAALLSALSGAPIDLSLAFTGAVSQSGAIMAVGGVSRKVEGFFEVCRRRGLTGRQGVLFPADNAVHLLLKDEVVEAVREGQFHLYPVATIEQAMTLLTGLPAGTRRKDGRYTPGSLYSMVDARMAELTRLAAQAEKPRSKRG
ncbi:MAG: AAA family ATPase [Humidesulfovibrio sp.]|uniref:Lon protease family protein n=1 Tax=Humidesulfovibrio sp. TaxID=2910988 RepID=UPI0027373C03|nr:ATP-binding protein [Humidesulfovibrio sp.]MDP2846861.1 AAA family ATPase [Humidesulfovibrio sp.]